MDQSLWLANQKQGAAVKSYLLHTALAGGQLPFTSLSKWCKKAGLKTILLSQTGMF
jgi:hypothetical protein